MARRPKSRREHPLAWAVEPLRDDPTYLERPMFGCLACYWRGRMVLVLAARKKPFQGILVPCEREHHGALQKDFPGLRVHTVLKKWLYLPEASEEFEEVAGALVEAVLGEDERVGIEPATQVRVPIKTSRPLR